MSSIEHVPEEQSAVHNDLSAIFVSLELSRSTWLITSLSPGGGEKMSKHQVWRRILRAVEELLFKERPTEVTVQ